MATYKHPLRLLRNAQGLALIEFAFVAPVLILLVLGGIEITRFVNITLRVDKAVYDLANIIAQSPPATSPATAGQLDAALLNTHLGLFTNLMRPHGDLTRQTVIVTSFRREGAANILRWRAQGGGSLATDVVSIASAGARGSAVTFPADVTTQLTTMMPNETALVIEVFYRYQPFLQPVLASFGITNAPQTITRRLFFNGREGALKDLPPTFPIIP